MNSGERISRRLCHGVSEQRNKEVPAGIGFLAGSVARSSNIVLVIPSLCDGGMERVMSELARFLVARTTAQVHLVLYGRKPVIFYPLPGELRLHVPGTRFCDSRRWLSGLRRMLFLRREVSGIASPVVLSFGEYWNSFVILALLEKKVPLFLSDRCAPGKRLGGIHDLLRRRLYPRAAGIIVQSASAERFYRQMFPGANLAVIPNPVREIVPAPPAEKEKMLLMVSRMITTKHHDRLLTIFSHLEAPGWRLVLVGGDDQHQHHMDRLSQLARTLGISDRVAFEGEQQEVDGYYRRAAIFLFTSSSEGFPNVVGEAMSAGLPVVSYDCVAGPSELITNGENGFLVPLFDDELFVERVRQLVEDEALRHLMGARARESMRRFRLEEVGQQYLNFMMS